MEKKNAAAEPWRESRERQYDLLAAGVREALDMDAIYRMMEEYA
jgi:cobyric acid synthase